MYGIAVIGTTGTGKTTWIKRFIRASEKKKFVFDYQNQYARFSRWTDVYDVDGFVEKIAIKRGAPGYKDTICVLEEATIYFGNRGYHKGMLSRMVSKRHTKNYFILVYHSFNDMPEYLKTYIDFFVIFYTDDTDKTIIKKFDTVPGLLVAARKLRKSPAWGRHLIISKH